LQIDIADDHLMLTNRTIASVTWVIGYCGRHFAFLLKTDDDLFVVPQRYVEYLSDLAVTDADDNLAFVGGLCFSGALPRRADGDKSFVAVSSYPGPVFPYHCKVSIVQQYQLLHCKEMFSTQCFDIVDQVLERARDT